MSLMPKKYNFKNSTYNISDIWIEGKNFVEDHARTNGNIIYIVSANTERGIALKAYFNSYKLNFTKAIDFENDASTNLQIPKEYGTDLSYQISLDIPAGTIDEARNNLAKIAELQRMLATPSNITNPVTDISYGSSNLFNPDQVKVPIFSVWFKNLIFSGQQYSSYPLPQDITIQDAMNYGFLCYIEEIKYEPEFESGFFEDDTELLPKNIKLSLDLKYGVVPEFSIKATARKVLPPSIPFISFKVNGHYGENDLGTFPFGVGVYSDDSNGGVAKENISSAIQDFTTTSMNFIDTSYEGGYDPTTIFVSMHIDKNKNTKSRNFSSANNLRKRYVRFKAFINSFDRNLKAGYTPNDNKNRSIGVSTVNLSKKSTLDELNYNLVFDVPSFNLEEAKKNCGKIQYLARMFVKSDDANELADSSAEQEAKDKLNKRDLKIYVPNFIENNKSYGKFDSFKDMYNSSLELVVENFSFEVNIEEGFYEEYSDNGKPKYVFPKSMKITLALKHTQPSSIIKNYIFKQNKKENYYKLQGGKKGDVHLFPYRRPYTEIRKK